MLDLFWQRILADMAFKALVVIAMLSPVVRMQAAWQKLVYLAVILVVTPISDDAFVLMAITGSAISLILGE